MTTLPPHQGSDHGHDEGNDQEAFGESRPQAHYDGPQALNNGTQEDDNPQALNNGAQEDDSPQALNSGSQEDDSPQALNNGSQEDDST